MMEMAHEINMHDLRELIDTMYHMGEVLVMVREIRTNDDGGYEFVLDKSGEVRPGMNHRGPFGDSERWAANGIFLLCGLDPYSDVGSVPWEVVRRVYDDDLEIIEPVWDTVDSPSDSAIDAVYDLREKGDQRLVGLPTTGDSPGD